ncbi:MAG: lactate racemase domain-containing protein [Planctomycetota bacterium]
MPTTLHVGAGRRLQIETEAEIGSPGASGVADVPAAECAAAAARQPLGYPPLSACLVPDDRVAIALGEGVPCFEEMLAGLVTALEDAGVDPGAVTIVAADRRDAEHLMTSPLGNRCEVVSHDASDDEQLCFAGVTHSEQQVLLNRRLVDADVVIPLTCARGPSDGSAGGGGVFADLYPAFADATAWQTPPTTRASCDGHRFTSLSDEVGWLLGCTLVAQAVPSRTGGVAAVFVGPPEAVQTAAQDLTARLWRQAVNRRANLVIATLSGDCREQTWENVGRAVELAERLTSDGGALALCTELDEPLDDSLAAVLACGDPDQAYRVLASSDAPGASAAAKLLSAQERGPVYFMSHLPPDWVEEVGLAPVADEAELSRLASRRTTCIIVEGAQHATVDLVEDPGDLAEEPGPNGKPLAAPKAAQLPGER